MDQNNSDNEKKIKLSTLIYAVLIIIVIIIGIGSIWLMEHKLK
jgi:heme/copper-type cytochrome/quinol oxidase subunit 4